MSDQIQIQQDGRILRITFNRPEGNGVSDSMAAALSDAVMKAHETSDCVVLRSVGPDFCTGRVRDADFPPSPELTHVAPNTIRFSTATKHCAVVWCQ